MKSIRCLVSKKLYIFLRAYLFIVIFGGQEVINNGHCLSQLLTQCIQEAICVLRARRFGEGVTPLVAAVDRGTGREVSGLWR